MKYMDTVDLIVEKDTYVKEGVHKGMQGWICDERRGQSLEHKRGKEPQKTGLFLVLLAGVSNWWMYTVKVWTPSFQSVESAGCSIVLYGMVFKEHWLHFFKTWKLIDVPEKYYFIF